MVRKAAAQCMLPPAGTLAELPAGECNGPQSSPVRLDSEMSISITDKNAELCPHPTYAVGVFLQSIAQPRGGDSEPICQS